MSTYHLPDYKERYFEHKELTKIHGKPTLDAITLIYNQLKRNAQSVPTTLGGGQLGYLFLILAPTAYASIPGAVAAVRPVDPGPFTLTPTPTPTPRATRNDPNPQPPPLTPADIAVQKSAWEERKRIYNEVQAVEHTLRTQLIQAIEPEYLQALRNTHTDMINESIVDIITFLISTYGQITDAEMFHREQALTSMTYDAMQPVDVVFNSVDKFAGLAELQQSPLDDKRKIQFAYVIFQRSRAYLDSLKKWNERPAVQKTYDRMKIFIREERKALEAVGALTIQDSLNQVELLKSMRNHQDELATRLETSLQANLMEALTQYGHLEREMQQMSPPQPLPCHQANTLKTQYQTDPAVLRTLEAITAQLAALTTTNNRYQRNKTSTQGGDDNNLPSINPRTGKPYKRYC